MDAKNNGSNDSHPVANSLAKSRILLVDDNDNIRAVFQEGLERRGFEVIPAASVNAALNLISTEKFDVLLSDLHMPNAGDGLTVVSAMRHAHPNAITVVSTILQSAMDSTIRNWMTRVEGNEELTAIKLSSQDRMGHLPLLLGELVRRLHLVPTTQALISKAAREHGVLRRKQGYTIAMVVEESRILQVTIFETLQNNLGKVDFSTVLLDVMAIADEVDSQLKQTVLGFMEAAPLKPVSLSA